MKNSHSSLPEESRVSMGDGVISAALGGAQISKSVLWSGVRRVLPMGSRGFRGQKVGAVLVAALGGTDVRASSSDAPTGRPNALSSLLTAILCSMALSTAFAGVFYPDGATRMHFAFEGSPNGDRPIVRPPAIYHADDGFGFVNSPGLIGTARGVTAPKVFRFDVNLPAGTYDVTVTLGGTDDESVTSIKAENRPTPVQDVHVAPGRNVVRTFTVTVRHGAAGDTSLEGDGRLNLEFSGTSPSLMKLDIAPSAPPPPA